MFNITTGKINLRPNEIKTVNIPKGKYKIKPIVLLSCTSGNNSYTLEKVTKNYFVVINNTQKNISLNYVVNKGFINSSLTQSSNILFIEGSSGTIHVPNFYMNDENFDLGTINLNDFFSYTAGEIINYSIINIVPDENNELSDFDTTDFHIDGNGIINLNDAMIYFNDVVFTVKGEMVRDNSKSDISTIRLNYVEETYQTNNLVYIIDTSPSTLDSYLGYHITYTAESGESTSSFVLPALSQNNSENYFKFTSNISSSPSMSLFLLSNDVSIYSTSNPDNPLQNRTIVDDLGNYANYNYEMLLEDQADYYFWYDSNDLTWYYSTERFPIDINS